MARPRIDVSENVKIKTAEVKERLNAKSESEAVAYMLAMFDHFFDGMTIKQHEALKIQAEDIQRQSLLKI